MSITITPPLDVPEEKKDTYIQNYELITKNTGKLMLFAGDQKVEHLNDDFYGEGVTPENANPEHLFNIASQANVGAFATQFGLISHYGMDYPNVPYIVKLNSKTHLVPTSIADPISRAWVEVEEVAELQENTNLPIAGIGYTIYLGSEHETYMFREASRVIREAHKHGMVAIIWAYIRGKAVADEKNPHIIAGAAGVGACLGADFVKVNYPEVAEGSRAEAFKEAVQAAGRAKVITAGGASTDTRGFLQMLHDQMHISGAWGNATGRNIHQRPLEEAIRFCNAIHAIVVDNESVDEAMRIFEQSS